MSVFIKLLIMIISLSFSSLSLAQSAQQPIGYKLLPDAQQVKTEKPQVIEFFSLACIHCYRMYPLVNDFIQQHPNVEVQKVHVGMNNTWKKFQRLYYSLLVLDNDKLIDAAFKATFEEKKNLADEEQLKAWLTANNVDIKSFTDIFHSFGVDTKIRVADQLAEQYNIQSTPIFIVNGKYETSPSLANGYQESINVLDQIINK